jgi:hypothetical protein
LASCQWLYECSAASVDATALPINAWKRAWGLGKTCSSVRCGRLLPPKSVACMHALAWMPIDAEPHYECMHGCVIDQLSLGCQSLRLSGAIASKSWSLALHAHQHKRRKPTLAAAMRGDDVLHACHRPTFGASLPTSSRLPIAAVVACMIHCMIELMLRHQVP